jgi:hypothetical protein
LHWNVTAVKFKGYVEVVEPFQVRGWAYDPEKILSALTVEVLIGDRTVGSTCANLFRADLEHAGIGSGEHAFIYNFDEKLDPADLDKVSVRVETANGSFQTLERVSGNGTLEIPVRPSVHFDGLTIDSDQRPIFVLGGARSGTSAMIQALLKLEHLKGHEEGHLIDLLAHLSKALNRFYRIKAIETTPGRSTMVSSVSQEYFEKSFNETFIRVIRSLFPDGSWVEKTPNADLILLAPRLRSIWPNSRFIFMKRRFLENLASRTIKFPSLDFSGNCRDWNDAMTAWLSVRPALHGVALEIDQRFLLRSPEEVAEGIGSLLKLRDFETQRLGQALRFDYPERTSPNRSDPIDISELGWTDEQTLEFERVCAKTMIAYGYTTDSSYSSGGTNPRFVATKERIFLFL